MNELEETRYLMSLAKNHNIIQLLAKHEEKLAAIEVEKHNENVTDHHDASPASISQPVVQPPRPMPAHLKYQPIDDFAWDQGGHNSEYVTVYVNLEGVGTVVDRVNCEFTTSSFDLVVMDLNGKNYRLLKDNLDKDIVPDKSTFSVKRNKVIVKLRKVKGEYSYDHWTSLTAKKPRTAAKKDPKADPMGGLMDMMKDMYEDGDDNMRKIIGEAMMKAQRGGKMDDPIKDV